MQQITLKNVLQAISAITPVPTTPDEREARLKEELVKIAGQSSSFLNESGEETYSPTGRYLRFVEEGV